MKIDMKEARKNKTVIVILVGLVFLGLLVSIQIARSAHAAQGMPVMLLSRTCTGGSMAGDLPSAECRVSSHGVVVLDARGNVQKQALVGDAASLQKSIQSAVSGKFKTARGVNPELPLCDYYAYPADRERIVLKNDGFTQSVVNSSSGAKRLTRYLDRHCEVSVE